MTQMDADERHEDLTGMDRIYRIRKGSFTMKDMKIMKENPGTPLSAAALKHFAFGDQRLAVGSRPASRRWRVRETIFCLQGKP